MKSAAHSSPLSLSRADDAGRVAPFARPAPYPRSWCVTVRLITHWTQWPGSNREGRGTPGSRRRGKQTRRKQAESICDQLRVMPRIRKEPAAGSRLQAREPDGTREYACDQGKTIAGLAPGPRSNLFRQPPAVKETAFLSMETAWPSGQAPSLVPSLELASATARSRGRLFGG